MVRLRHPLCPGCASPGRDHSCTSCTLQPLAIDDVTAPFVFSGVARKAVHQLKYRDLRALAPRMATVMAEVLREHSPPANVLVPVPLHPRQLRW